MKSLRALVSRAPGCDYRETLTSGLMRRALPILLLLALGSCRDPRADANVAQAMMDVGAQVSMLQQDQSILQGQVDSLLQVVAWQDTVIRRLASHTGLPMSR